MSTPSPPPPPLPPPTVPSRNAVNQPPPPPPKHPLTAASPSLSALLETSSVPPPASEASSSSPSDPTNVQQTSDLNSQPDDSSPKKHRRRLCCSLFRPRFTSHHIHEPARSVWFDTRVLLLSRLALTAVLLGHLVFFSLRGDFSYRLYSTWNYAGLAVAFLFVVMCSLLDVLRDEDSQNDDDIGPTQGEGMVTDVEHQPVGQPSLPDPKLARALTRVTVPLYQVFVTATLFGTIVYWAAIYDSTIVSISYPLMILKVFAPAAALLDFLLSLRMRFRLLYVLIYTLYNGFYVAALVLFDKLQGDPVYAIFDPSAQSQEDFIAKTAGIAAASFVAGLLMYAISYVPALPCLPGKRKRTRKKRDSVDGSDILPTTSSDGTSDSSDSKVVESANRDAKNAESGHLRKVTRKEDGSYKSLRFGQKKDRLSLPLSGSGAITPSTSAQWFRSSSARMASSRSGSSIGSEDRRDSFARNDSEKRSTWEALEQPTARVEDEYFAMPAVSAEREVIKLKPLPRVDSAASLPGIMSRSSSGRMSRSGSRRMSRSGSRTMLVRSVSDRSGAAKSFVRNGSGTSLR